MQHTYPFAKRNIDGLAIIGRTIHDLRGLRFDEGEEGNQPAFPADTPVAEMTPDQQAAYWKDKARKHESRSKTLTDALGGKTPEEIAQIISDNETFRTQTQTEQERAIAEAREEARLQGENIGAARYVNAAVRGEIRALLASKQVQDSDEVTAAIDGLLDTLDVNKLLTDTGDVDTDKIATIVSPLIQPVSARQGNSDSYSETFRQSRQGPSEAGSVAAYQAQYADQYKTN